MSVQKIILVGAKNVGKALYKDKLMSMNDDNGPGDLTGGNLTTGYNRFLPWSIGKHSLQIEFKIVEPDEMPAVRDTFYRSANGFICMFSLDDLESFRLIQKMREQILDVRSQTRLVLVGNKCDLPKKSRKISKKDAKKLAKSWKAEYLETSIPNNQNVEECLNILLKAIIENKHTAMIKERTSLKSTLDRFKYYNCLQ